MGKYDKERTLHSPSSPYALYANSSRKWKNQKKEEKEKKKEDTVRASLNKLCCHLSHLMVFAFVNQQSVSIISTHSERGVRRRRTSPTFHFPSHFSSSRRHLISLQIFTRHFKRIFHFEWFVSLFQIPFAYKKASNKMSFSRHLRVSHSFSLSIFSFSLSLALCVCLRLGLYLLWLRVELKSEL